MKGDNFDEVIHGSPLIARVNVATASSKLRRLETMLSSHEFASDLFAT